MKVIHTGDLHTWVAEAECSGRGNGGGGCWARLLVEAQDVFGTCVQNHGETRHFISFRCCLCGTHTDLPRTQYPPATVEVPPLAEWLRRQKTCAPVE